MSTKLTEAWLKGVFAAIAALAALIAIYEVVIKPQPPTQSPTAAPSAPGIPPTATLTATPTATPATTPTGIPTTIRTPTVTPTPIILFEDDFENPSRTIRMWSEERGVWSASTGRYFHKVSSSDWGLALAGNKTWQDYIFEVDVMAVEIPDKVVVIRYVDHETTYHINLRAEPINDLLLVRGMPGSQDVLAIATVTNSKNAWYRLKIIAIGPTLQVFVNDKKYIDVVDNKSAILSGRIGLFGWSSQTGNTTNYFDNVKVFSVR